MQLSPVLYRQKTTTMVTLITGYVGNAYLIYFTLKYGFFGKHLTPVGEPTLRNSKISSKKIPRFARNAFPLKELKNIL